MSRIGNPDNLKSARAALGAMSKAVSETTLDQTLLELVKIRASQINGCGICLTTHVEKALQLGDRVDRLSVIPAWREAPWFSERERAALAWTEAVCAIGHRRVTDDDWANVKGVFDEREVVELTMNILAISGWNRMNAAFGTEAMSFDYPPKAED